MKYSARLNGLPTYQATISPGCTTVVVDGAGAWVSLLGMNKPIPPLSMPLRFTTVPRRMASLKPRTVAIGDCLCGGKKAITTQTRCDAMQKPRYYRLLRKKSK